MVLLLYVNKIDKQTLNQQNDFYFNQYQNGLNNNSQNNFSLPVINSQKAQTPNFDKTNQNVNYYPSSNTAKLNGNNQMGT